jgi:hypothetical protein
MSAQRDIRESRISLRSCGLHGLMGLLLVAAVRTAAAQPLPPEGYKLDPEFTEKSPDGTITIEQYARDDAHDGYRWQFWVRRDDKLTLLDPEPADYPAGFRFTNDSRWLVRMQKTGSGEASLYLYRLAPRGFVPATAKPLGDLAWAYFYSRPDARKIRRPDFHISAGLVKGLDENYRSLDAAWPANRYLVISLWGEVEPTARHRQLLVVRGWHCRYDLVTGRFDVPASFAANNAKAIAPERN